MRFVIATWDYSGLGFAIRIQDEGHEVLLATNPPEEVAADAERLRRYEQVGSHMVPKQRLSEVMAKRTDFKDAYWVWDHNHSVEENETLRREGFKVLGGGSYSYKMEHDRAACLEHTALFGLIAPPSTRFDDPREAVRFCERNKRTAYVYKPDQGANFETFLPESEDPMEANEELRLHLSTVEPDCAFILQERKEGVETNVEVWFVDGEPVMAFMALEAKKRYALDMGELIGCAFDFAFIVPLDCRAVQESVGRLFPYYKNMKYTGFGDANFTAARDGIWFFEKCERLGYNAHPNLLFNLSRRGVAEVFAGLIDKSLRPDFSGGFGASVTMMTKENPGGSKAIMFPPQLWPDIFWWDVCKRDDLFLTAGFDSDGYVLIVNSYGYTIPTAWESVMKKAAQIRFPYRHYRTDGAGVDYPSSPIRRYEGLKAMGYI